jgi:hypothetical protein
MKISGHRPAAELSWDRAIRDHLEGRAGAHAHDRESGIGFWVDTTLTARVSGSEPFDGWLEGGRVGRPVARHPRGRHIHHSHLSDTLG